MSTPGTATKTTPDIVAEQIDKLRRLFPEVITEGEGGTHVDFDRLRATLGDLAALDGSQKVSLSLQCVLKTI